MHRTTYNDISIIIPFYNEEGNVGPVIREVMEKVPGAEIVAVDDGSTDHTASELRKFPAVRVVTFFENRGQGFAIYAGIALASNECCVLMDGDGQHEPAYIPLLVDKLGEFDLVCGLRKIRQHYNFSRKIASKIGNTVRRAIFGDNIVDTTCLKAIRKTPACVHLFPFKGLHRYIPSIFHRASLKITQVYVTDRPRLRGYTKYTNTRRAVDGIIEVLMAKHALDSRYR